MLVNLHMACIYGSGKIWLLSLWTREELAGLEGKELVSQELVSAPGLSKELFQGKEMVPPGTGLELG